MTSRAGARTGGVPPRSDWPEPAPQTEAGALLTEVVLATFRLNARVLDAAQQLAAAGGLTAGGRCSAGSWTSRARWPRSAGGWE